MSARHKIGISAAAFLLLALVFFIATPVPRGLRAQGIGPGGSFSVGFSFPYGAAPQTVYLPACGSTFDAITQQTMVGTPPNCIPNSGQTADMVSFIWSSNCESPGGFFDLEASDDGRNWLVLATGHEEMQGATESAGTVYSNGWYLYRRLAVSLCQGTNPGAGQLTGDYTGYSGAIPVNPISRYVVQAQPLVSTTIAAFLSTSWSTVLGLQCQNPNSATSFLALTALSPFSGTPEIFYQTGIAAGATFVYAGPAMLFRGPLTGGAFTTWSGSTSSASPLNCTFQLGSGPFYDNLPASLL
jgi:hypothetical protein